MRSPIGSAITLVLGLFLFTTPCLAWSHKEHILFTRLAASRLLDDPATPPAMKTWLRQAAGDVPDLAGDEQFFIHTHIGIDPKGFTGLSYWAYVPDLHANDRGGPKVAPFGVHERLLHFIDLELLMSGDARRGYRHDLSGKPQLSDIPRDMADPRYIQAGMLPFRIGYCYNQLVQSIRNGRLNAPTVAGQEEKTATYWAGFLGHYLADSTQPQHATLDYKSQSYFADKRKAPNVHAEVEYRMCDDEVNEHLALRKEYWPLLMKSLAEFADPVQTRDPWQASMEVSFKSYDALPLIGLAAMQAAQQGGTPEHPQGSASKEFDTEAFFHFRGQYMGREMSVIEMKAIQTAWAIKRIERVWRQAWEEAEANAER